MFEEDLPIFVEIEEFAQEIELDGVKMPAQVIPMSKTRSERLREQFDGLSGEIIEIYFKAADYTSERKRLPVFGEWSWLNGKRYDVISSQDELGMAHMVLGAYRQRALR